MHLLHPKAAGLAVGLVWGLSLLLLGLGATWFDYGNELVSALGKLYLGFRPSLVGSLIGLVWGWLDGFILGFLLAWCYNLFLPKG